MTLAFGVIFVSGRVDRVDAQSGPVGENEWRTSISLAERSIIIVWYFLLQPLFFRSAQLVQSSGVLYQLYT